MSIQGNDVLAETRRLQKEAYAICEQLADLRALPPPKDDEEAASRKEEEQILEAEFSLLHDQAADLNLTSSPPKTRKIDTAPTSPLFGTGCEWHGIINNYITSRTNAYFNRLDLSSVDPAPLLFDTIVNYIEDHPVLKQSAENKFLSNGAIKYYVASLRGETEAQEKILDQIVWRREEKDVVIFEWKFYLKRTRKKRGQALKIEKEQVQVYQELVNKLLSESDAKNTKVSAYLVIFDLDAPQQKPDEIEVEAVTFRPNALALHETECSALSFIKQRINDKYQTK